MDYARPGDLSFAKERGLTEEEFSSVEALLGRSPNRLELCVVAAMWSEHCSYKSSRKFLRRFPSNIGRTLLGPGGNAGAVDLGGGVAAVFKIESHNHPSYIEPYQGAATGVGGIIRDVIAMGARPVVLLDSLRFGSLTHPRMPYLVHGVISGISDYGNSIGVPTVGGEFVSHPTYDGNILVNVFALGLAPTAWLCAKREARVGDKLIYFGAATGRDGIGGATMASQSFEGEGESQKLPTVQVGDPFVEKLLIEICSELVETQLIVELQDMGAAGLTSSVSELANRLNLGAELHLNQVPVRAPHMTPWELMLSESQERMVAVVREEKVPAVFEVCKRWGVEVATIGSLMAEGILNLYWDGEQVGDVPISVLTTEAPCYERKAEAPVQKRAVSLKGVVEKRNKKNFNEEVLRLLSSPNLCNKEFIYRQYDHMVQTNTVIPPGGDAAVIKLKGRKDALALVVEGNGEYCERSPRVGGAIAVAEGVRNLACVGAGAIGASDCLNFGNPEQPSVMWQFREVIEGISEACEHFGIPVVSGNVSFYNETSGVSIAPTPVVALVGQLEEGEKTVSYFTKRSGDLIALLGDSRALRRVLASPTAFSYGGICGELKVCSGDLALEPELEERVAKACIAGIRRGLFSSAHDCGDGGIAISLAESAIASGLGAEVFVPGEEEGALALFNETQSRILVTFAPQQEREVHSLLSDFAIPWEILGKIGGKRLCIAERVDISLADLKEAWNAKVIS